MAEIAETRGVRVQVVARFVPEQSSPAENEYLFAYQISIRNLSDHPVQILNRHWVITDGRGRVEEVKGPGVIGQQPRLGPGEEFNYESFCPLRTPTGEMRGTYEMMDLQAGESFLAEIPSFFLVEPSAFH
jgi:ApaG protein